MSSIANGLLLLLVLLDAALLATGWNLARRVDGQLGRFSRVLASTEGPLRKRQFEEIEADNRRLLLKQSVEGSTSAIELFHRAITTTTFEAIDKLSRSERVRENNMRAREIHDDASRNVYRSVRIANRQIHAVADVIIRMNRKRQGRNDRDPE